VSDPTTSSSGPSPYPRSGHSGPLGVDADYLQELVNSGAQRLKSIAGFRVKGVNWEAVGEHLAHHVQSVGRAGGVELADAVCDRRLRETHRRRDLHLRRPRIALEQFEENEVECLRAAALRRFENAERWTFETTIAAVVAAQTTDFPQKNTIEMTVLFPAGWGTFTLHEITSQPGAAGAKPLTTTFTVPSSKILTDQVTFFSTIEVAESIFVGAYMAAVREFAELGQPTLAKYAYQIGAVEAEHRVLARTALVLEGIAGDVPPNNKAFETDYFLYVRDAATVLTQLGFIGGSGTAVTYPGRAAALAAAGPFGGAVIQRTPNNATTSITATGNLTGERT